MRKRVRKKNKNVKEITKKYKERDVREKKIEKREAGGKGQRERWQIYLVYMLVNVC